VEDPQARKLRRPRLAAQDAAQVAQWLREDPAISAIQVLRRAQAAGYRGGKSAFYELVRRLRTLDARSGGSRQLIVVARDHEGRYQFFRRAFDNNVTVQVILDRRVADRRQRVECRARERRRRNRRSPQPIDGTLRTEGWTIIRLRASTNRRDST
jgi:hypothetical protein